MNDMIDLQNDVYEIRNKTLGIRDLINLMDLGLDGVEIGSALTPVIDLMDGLYADIDKLYHKMHPEINKIEESEPNDLPFT